jgi:hypothetical protein
MWDTEAQHSHSSNVQVRTNVTKSLSIHVKEYNSIQIQVGITCQTDATLSKIFSF